MGPPQKKGSSASQIVKRTPRKVHPIKSEMITRSQRRISQMKQRDSKQKNKDHASPRPQSSKSFEFSGNNKKGKVPAPNKKRSRASQIVTHTSCEVITQSKTIKNSKAQTSHINETAGEQEDMDEYLLPGSSASFDFSGSHTEYESRTSRSKIVSKYSKAIHIKKKMTDASSSKCDEKTEIMKLKEQVEKMRLQLESYMMEKDSSKAQKKSIEGRQYRNHAEALLQREEFSIEEYMKEGKCYGCVEAELKRRGYGPNDEMWNKYESLKPYSREEAEQKLEDKITGFLNLLMEKRRLTKILKKMQEERDSVISQNKNLLQNISDIEKEIHDFPNKMDQEEKSRERKLKYLNWEIENLDKDIKNFAPITEKVYKKYLELQRQIVIHRIEGRTPFVCDTCKRIKAEHNFVYKRYMKTCEDYNKLNESSRRLNEKLHLTEYEKNALELEIAYLQKKYVYTRMKNNPSLESYGVSMLCNSLVDLKKRAYNIKLSYEKLTDRQDIVEHLKILTEIQEMNEKTVCEMMKVAHKPGTL